MRTGKLNARKVATVKPGKYGDGGGLWLYVGPNSRSWVYRYMIVGKAREMGLGSFGNLTLEEARELARQHRRGVQSAKHRQQWENTLATHVHPIIGNLPIKTINRDMVVRVLQPIWHDKPETSRRIRMRIETIVDYAIARKIFKATIRRRSV